MADDSGQLSLDGGEDGQQGGPVLYKGRPVAKGKMATVGDVPGTGQLEMFDDDDYVDPNKRLPPPLYERFGVVPFTLLDAKAKYWKGRKQGWLSLGIQSELGRGEQLREGADASEGNGYKVNTKASSGANQTSIGEKYGRKPQTGTSVFDPVLCELAYRWFSPPGGLVLDPFAGGSVRGIVATKLGRRYVGIDLNPHQVQANQQQAHDICAGDPLQPVWRNGDSTNIPTLCAEDPLADFVFTCPPYYDLEVYSSAKEDISNAGSYKDFVATYRHILWHALARLQPNRFAGIVIGEIRDQRGNYRPFLQDTITIFEQLGLWLYNAAIYTTPVGSMPVRASNQFTGSRKLGRIHQHLLIFIKGDARKACEDIGPVEAGLIE